MPGRWLSPRALLAHLALLVTVPLFLAAGWWQVHRAESGNTLSYGYAVEWPLFAVVAVYLWWDLIHMTPAEADTGQASAQPPVDDTTMAPPHLRCPEEESPELRAYNDYLSLLATSGRAKTWRNPKGLP